MACKRPSQPGALRQARQVLVDPLRAQHHCRQVLLDRVKQEVFWLSWVTPILHLLVGVGQQVHDLATVQEEVLLVESHMKCRLSWALVYWALASPLLRWPKLVSGHGLIPQRVQLRVLIVQVVIPCVASGEEVVVQDITQLVVGVRVYRQ